MKKLLSAAQTKNVGGGLMQTYVAWEGDGTGFGVDGAGGGSEPLYNYSTWEIFRGVVRMVNEAVGFPPRERIPADYVVCGPRG